MSYLLSSQPFLDKFNSCYKNILTINKMPEGPLKQYVKRINPPKLSIFSENSRCCPNSTCIYAFHSFNNKHELLCIDDIGDLFHFMVTNKYVINTELTKVIQKSGLKLSNNTICFFDYKL